MYPATPTRRTSPDTARTIDPDSLSITLARRMNIRARKMSDMKCHLRVAMRWSRAFSASVGTLLDMGATAPPSTAPGAVLLPISAAARQFERAPHLPYGSHLRLVSTTLPAESSSNDCPSVESLKILAPSGWISGPDGSNRTSSERRPMILLPLMLPLTS